RPGGRPGPPLPADRGTERARLVRGPHDHRARGPGSQAGPGLRLAAERLSDEGRSPRPRSPGAQWRNRSVSGSGRWRSMGQQDRTGMDVRWISQTGVAEHAGGELEGLLERDDGFVWVDVPVSGDDTAQHLSDLFGFHPLAIRDVIERRHVPKLHAYLERRVREGNEGDPVRLLEEMFLMRHELLSIRTTAAESRDVFARMGALTRMIPPEAPPLIDDLIDRFERVKSLCDNEKEFTQGIIDFYQARTTTRMNVAMERLALIAAVLLPVTAIASIYGMNLIVEERSDLPQLGIVLAVMVLVTG